METFVEYSYEFNISADNSSKEMTNTNDTDINEEEGNNSDNINKTKLRQV